MSIHVLERPLLRGTLHAAVFFAAIPAGTLLLLNAGHAAARAAVAIYAGSLLAGFGSSAAYHRLAKSLIAAGGITYTAGVPIPLLRRPDPWPRIFGYHEVWHVFTVVAAVLQFAAVASIITG